MITSWRDHDFALLAVCVALSDLVDGVRAGLGDGVNGVAGQSDPASHGAGLVVVADLETQCFEEAAGQVVG
ncbi:MAG: hypothetical protein GEV10_21685 [Streptosporangiales bacterium]|nr:hypothetical protein [Streptosporangiales bacterium]